MPAALIDTSCHSNRYVPSAVWHAIPPILRHLVSAFLLSAGKSVTGLPHTDTRGAQLRRHRTNAAVP